MKTYEKLRRYMKEHGHSQKEVADKLGITRQAVWNILHGYVELKVEDFLLICDALGVDVETILNYAVPT